MKDNFDFSNEPNIGYTYNEQLINDVYKLTYCDNTKNQFMKICNLKNEVLLVLNVNNYIKLLNNSDIIIYFNDIFGKGIFVYSIVLDKLEPYIDFNSAFLELKKYYETLNMATINKNRYVNINIPELEEGIHNICIPDGMRKLDEVLFFSDFILNRNNITNKLESNIALYAIDFVNSKVTVYPQDWFNIMDFDFRHICPLQAKRNNDRSISVRGLGFLPFVLDENNRESIKPITWKP
jgi:hypothetical protein